MANRNAHLMTNGGLCKFTRPKPMRIPMARPKRKYAPITAIPAKMRTTPPPSKRGMWHRLISFVHRIFGGGMR